MANFKFLMFNEIIESIALFWLFGFCPPGLVVADADGQAAGAPGARFRVEVAGNGAVAGFAAAVGEVVFAERVGLAFDQQLVALGAPG